MSPTPSRPVQHSFQRRRSLPHQTPQESTHLGDRQGKELSGFLLLKLGPFFCSATLTTVKKARANMANVIWRYQPYLPFGQFNGFFHLPPAASRSHNLFQANLLRGEDEVVGDLGGIGQTAPGEQPLLPPRL